MIAIDDITFKMLTSNWRVERTETESATIYRVPFGNSRNPDAIMIFDDGAKRWAVVPTENN